MGLLNKVGAYEVDKYFTLAVAKLEIGRAEEVLAIPGNWFGIPLLHWAICPLLAHFAKLLLTKGIRSQNTAVFGSCVAIPAVYLGLRLWNAMIESKKLDRIHVMVRDYFIPVILTPHFLTSFDPVTSFVISSWACCQIPTFLLKVVVQRTRPLIALETELKDVKRVERLEQIKTTVLRGNAGTHSFPSGDAAGAASFSGALFVYFGSNPIVFLPMILSAFGRVYFHAHHVFDVAVGSSIGFSTSIIMARLKNANNFSLVDVGYSIGAFVSLIFVAHKIEHRILESRRREDENKDSGYAL
eukprot:maker-scaffold_39-snap-gene-2.74-mRNA-1 protein AED:0.08 eAED:0.09 QI:0/0.66/0.75/1/1/1/4/335/298